MTTNKMKILWLIYLFLVSSTCFGRSSPIIRSTWLYLKLLVLTTDIAAGWCHGWDGTELLVSSTCFGWCLRPSSGALDCIYSIWFCLPVLLPAGVMDEMELTYRSALHVSGDVFAHHQEHLTVFTASDIVHRYCCRLVSWMRWNSVPQQQYRWTIS